MVMARVAFPDVDIPADYARFDALARECRLRGGAEGGDRDRIASIATVLGEKGFAYVAPEVQKLDRRWADTYGWPHVVLASRRGHRNGLTLLYVAIGERLGLGLVPAIVPGHALPRLGDFNVETLSDGRLLEDDHYRRKYGAVPRPLSARESLGLYLCSNLGHWLFGQKRPADALLCYEHATRLFPEFTDAWTSRGIALRKLARPQEALESLDRAIALRPEDPYAWNHRGHVLKDLGRPDEAADCYKRARGQKPR